MKTEMSDSTRQAYYEASIKNRFVTFKEIKSVVPVNPTVEEFTEILLDKSPTAIYHDLWSKDNPLYVIPKMIYRSRGGVEIYSNAWADKTIVFRTWQELYDEFRIQGLENFKF